MVSKLLPFCTMVLLLAGCLASLGGATGQGSGETQNITLYGSATQGWGLSQQSMSIPGPNISFEEGVLVNMTLISVDGMVHDFFVDYDGNGAINSGEPHSPTFSSTVNYQFTPDRTGQFTYYCSFHPTTMRGNSEIIPEFTVASLVALMVALTTIVMVVKRRRKAVEY